MCSIYNVAFIQVVFNILRQLARHGHRIHARRKPYNSLPFRYPTLFWCHHCYCSTIRLHVTLCRTCRYISNITLQSTPKYTPTLADDFHSAAKMGNYRTLHRKTVKMFLLKNKSCKRVVRES